MTPPQQDAAAADELINFRQMAANLRPSPGGIPRLKGVDIYGRSLPLQDETGGDHIIYIDFNQRYDMPRRIEEAETEGRPEVAERLRACCRRAGILLADVSGHRATDALIAAMLHQAFLTGAYYELDYYGEITTKLFEHLNQRFYRTTTVNKFLTMIYGEISDEGRFRFISAGHPRPMIFSREFGAFVDISADRLVSYPPVGMFPSTNLNERVDPGRLGYKQPYTVNEIDLLANGDLLLLYTDGLSEHAGGTYFPRSVEGRLARLSDQSAKTVCEFLFQDLLTYGSPQDDISVVVIKKTHG
jgi:serine phosphatase RsbU (regulator of sigma subunit)